VTRLIVRAPASPLDKSNRTSHIRLIVGARGIAVPRAVAVGAWPGGIGFTAGVITDARARQRRVRYRGALAALFVVLVAGLSLGSGGPLSYALQASSAGPSRAHAHAVPVPQISYVPVYIASGERDWLDPPLYP
jgi:hypothetical protein